MGNIMKQNINNLFLTGLIGLGLAVAAQASVLSYDQDVVPITGSSNAVYFGTGNPNGGWTTTTGVTADPNTQAPDTIELGLRAKYRGGSIIDEPSNTYYVPDGTSANGDALWNYEFSIDLNPAGSGNSLTMSDIVATISVVDSTTGASAIFNAIGTTASGSAFGDSASTGPVDNGEVYFDAGTSSYVVEPYGPNVTDAIGAQNSENVAFFDPSLGFYASPGDDYTITLNVSDTQSNLLASDVIYVDATPEPATFGLIGLSLFGLAAIRKKLLA
jgi:hypothetical protein